MMKRFLYSFIVIILFSNHHLIAKSDDHNPLDSILAIIDTIEGTKPQIDYIYTIFNNNLADPLSVDLLQNALERATIARDSAEQIRAIFSIGRCYYYQKNISSHSKVFQLLRRKSFEYNMYQKYFTSWYSILQRGISTSDIVYVNQEVKKMRKEADSLNSNEGYVYSSLIQAALYKYENKKDETIKIYKELIKSSRIGYIERFRTYHRLVGLYINRQEYDKAIDNIRVSEKLLYDKLEEQPKYKGIFNNRFLDVELAYCLVYTNMNDVDQLKLHLDRAKEYLSKNNFHSQSMLYYSYYGQYYYLIGDYDNAVKSYKIALAVIDKNNLSSLFMIRRKMAEAYAKMGDYKQSAIIYRERSASVDSLNALVLARHEEILHNNYIIKQELSLYQQNKAKKTIFLVFSMLVIAGLLLYFVITLLRIRAKLKVATNNTKEALDKIILNDEAKDKFLRNITFETRTPLNTVIGFTDLLTIDKSLSKDEIKEYSRLISKSANELLEMINMVLEISRLEAGMMHFESRELSISQLLDEVASKLKIDHNMKIDFVIEGAIKEMVISADQKWIMRVMISLLSPIANLIPKTNPVMIVSRVDGDLVIEVKGSPLYNSTEKTQYMRLQDMVNKLYIMNSGGVYEVFRHNKEEIVRFTYPLSPI